MSMSADLSNKVTIDSVLERPEWGGDAQVMKQAVKKHGGHAVVLRYDTRGDGLAAE